MWTLGTAGHALPAFEYAKAGIFVDWNAYIKNTNGGHETVEEDFSGASEAVVAQNGKQETLAFAIQVKVSQRESQGQSFFPGNEPAAYSNVDWGEDDFNFVVQFDPALYPFDPIKWIVYVDGWLMGPAYSLSPTAGDTIQPAELGPTGRVKIESGVATQGAGWSAVPGVQVGSKVIKETTESVTWIWKGS